MCSSYLGVIQGSCTPRKAARSELIDVIHVAMHVVASQKDGRKRVFLKAALLLSINFIHFSNKIFHYVIPIKFRIF
jgi:hypothetical protein